MITLKTPLILVAMLAFFQVPAQVTNDLTGAWETMQSDGSRGVWIITPKHFSIAWFKQKEFLYTEGGKWEWNDGKKMELMWEFHTNNRDLVGQKKSVSVKLKGSELTISDTQWKRVDNGEPGRLAGAWLITGRKRNGEMRNRTPGARKTMKILSGTRFQWIAYNSDTGEFLGTGGGTYSTKEGIYTENIEFFSRDNSRVGAILPFNFELKEGHWHHSGKSSKGDPIYEIWSTRPSLGI